MAFFNTDIPELAGFDTGICLTNLDVLGLRQDTVSESVLAVLSELSDAILRDAGGDPDTVDSILLSLQSPQDDETTEADRSSSHVAPVNRDLLCRMSARSALYARLLLYRMIVERMPPPAEKEPLSSLPTMTQGRVAYMPSAFADKAYLRLTASLKNPRATATASFVDACEEVHSGLCEYCILPLENSHNGRLTAFSRLIIRYRLQVVAICDLETGALEGQSTRFALLRATNEGSFPTPLTAPAKGDPLYLELIHVTDIPSLTDLLTASEFCGLRLIRADTLPPFDELEAMTEEGQVPAIACVLDTSGADITTFRRFLSLEAPEDILTGLYGIV